MQPRAAPSALNPGGAVIGESVIRAVRVPPEKGRHRFLRGRFKNQPVIARISASVVLWAFEKHTANICGAVEEWRDLDLWGRLSALRRNTIELSRDPRSVTVELNSNSSSGAVALMTTTVSLVLPQDSSHSLTLDFGTDSTTAQDWYAQLRLMTLSWADLISQSKGTLIPTLQATGLVKSLGLTTHQVPARAQTTSSLDHPVSSDISDPQQNAIDVIHDKLLESNAQVQNGAEWVGGVIEALDITLPVFEEICSKLPLVGAAVQLTCLALSTISVLYGTKAERRLVDDVRMRLNRIAARVLLEMLHAGSRRSLDDTEYVQNLQSIMAELERSHAALDKYVIASVVSRAASGPIPSSIQTRLEEIENNLARLRNLHIALQTSKNVEGIRKQLNELKISIANRESASVIDTFKPAFLMTYRVDLERMPVVTEACPMFESVKQALTDSKRKKSYRAIHVHGEGGIGKTVMCCLLVADEDIQNEFYEGCLWVQLGKGISESGVVAEISRKVKRFGGIEIAQKIDKLAKQKDGLEEAVEMVGDFFRGRHVVLFLDNVWLRPPEKKSWYEVLSRLVPGSNSTVVVSSREKNVCESHAVHSIKLTPLKIAEEESQRRAAITLFDFFFDRTTGEHEWKAEKGNSHFVSEREELLKLTCGIHILIEMVAKYVANCRISRKQTLQSARQRLKDRILYLSTQGYYESPHMAAVISESLAHIDDVAARDSLGFISEIRKNHEPDFFSQSYEALCIAPEERGAVPVSLLQLLWELSYDEALAVAEMFESASIAKIEATEFGTCIGFELVLHDLQRTFCEEGASRNRRLHSHHENLLRRFGAKRNASLCDPDYDWSLDCFPTETSEQEVKERGYYMARHLVRHMIAAEGSGDKGMKSGLLRVVSDFRWISKRGNHFGRNGLLQDLRSAAPLLTRSDSMSLESFGTSGNTSIKAIRWTDSEMEFLGLLRRIIMSIPPDAYEGFGGQFASSVATSLYGRVEAARDWIRRRVPQGVFDINSSEAPFSVVKGLADMSRGILDNIHDIWLLPVTVYADAPQGMDDRMEFELAVSNDQIRGVTALASGYHVVTAGCDGKIRIHDITTGETTWSFSQHHGTVLCVKSTNRDFDDQGEHVVSSSVDGSIRVWRVDGEFRPTLHFVQCLAIPGEATDERDHKQQPVHVDVTKDGKLIVAYRKFRVHLWKRSPGKSGKYEYKYALPGSIKLFPMTLAVSDDGSFVACGGFGAPHLVEWKLTKDASESDEDWLSRWLNVPEALTETLSVTLSSVGTEPRHETKFCWFGTRFGLCVHDVSCNEGKDPHQVASFLRKGVTSISVLSHEQDGRHCELLLGHRDGSITRHQSLLHDCNESYGKRSPFGSNAVICMAVLQTSSGLKERPARFVTGHANGILRVWRFEYRPQVLSSGPVPIDESSNVVSGGSGEALVHLASTSTPGGTIIVSGSSRGQLSIWKASSGEQLASRRVRTIISFRSGRRMFLEISALDISYVNGSIVVLSGASDYKLRTWDVSRNGTWEVRMPQAEQWSMGPGVTEYGVRPGFSMTLMSSDGRRVVVALTDGDVRIYESREGIWDGSTSVHCVYSSSALLACVRFQQLQAFHNTKNFKALAISEDGTCYVLMDFRGMCLFINASDPSNGALGWRNDVKERDRVIPSCVPLLGRNSCGSWRESSVSGKYIDTQLKKKFVGRNGAAVTVRCFPQGNISSQRVNVHVDGDDSARTTTSVSFDAHVEDILLMKTEADETQEGILLACGLRNGSLPIFRLVT